MPNNKRQEEDQIFISWSGSLSRKIAEYLRYDLFEYADLKPWISSHDITAGNAWFEETSAALDNSRYGVVCLTPGASKKPWINFEIGWLYGKLNNCKIITFGEEIDNPLACLQRLNGHNKETWYELLRAMIPDEKRADDEIWDRVNKKFPEIEKLFKLSKESPDEYYCELDQHFSTIHDVMEGLKKNHHAQENVLFQRVISKSYADLITYSEQLQSTFSIPEFEYPKYLIHLQERENPIVKAIALIGVKENFWRLPPGNKIKETSHSDSIRIFSFSTKDDFQAYFQVLREHARKYKVYAIHYQRLSNILGDKASDFSIISSSSISLLARYQDESELQNQILFVSDSTIIQDYARSYDDLMRSNFVVEIYENNKDSKDGNYSDEDIKNISRRVFYGVSSYPRRTVEMSLYINVFDYNEYEDKHAYYSEMTKKMIAICQEDCAKNNYRDLEVSEFGAGTGIFTMKLANGLTDKLKKLDAIEYDWHCYKILDIKTREFTNSYPEIDINVYHEDSRTYDPDGEFNYIFSTFADHHIKKGDKEIYFENVKKNLKPGGLMIVGDEFLREHDPENKKEREDALYKYHNHIINIAEDEGHDVLAVLEQQALESGLKETGDFKVSCSQYEQFLKNAGFKFRKEQVSTMDYDSVGGIFVYTAWL